MKLGRRRLLRLGVLVCAAGIGTAGSRARADVDAKRIVFRNLHTAEQLDVEFASGGEFSALSMTRIQRVLRDFRTGEEHAIDPALVEQIHGLALSLGVDPVFDVISGFRSPLTNERLRQRGSGGVSKHSLHMQGRAIDVRLAGVPCERLAGRALELARGGVGFYRASDFVHLDTGAFRTWRG
jgi:uncharacterized protein YcbK (DUF882 family)